MRVNQFLEGIKAYGDSISNDAYRIRKILLGAGYESDIFVNNKDSDVPDFVRHYSTYKEDKSDINILHATIGGKTTKFVSELNTKRGMVFHNFTPHYYFKDVNDEHVRLLRDYGYELSRISDKFDFVVADSEYNKEVIEDLGYRNVEVMPIFMDFSEYEGCVRLKKSTVSVLAVGRIVPNKRYEDVILSFYYYNKFINGDSELNIVGNYRDTEKYYIKLLQFSKELGIKVDFLGFIENKHLAQYYFNSDVFLCMSEHEGFCIPLVECMFFGLPIIAYNSTAIPYTLKDCGVLIYEKDHKAVAELIDMIVKDGLLRKSIVGKQRARADYFIDDKHAKRLIQIVKRFEI